MRVAELELSEMRRLSLFKGVGKGGFGQLMQAATCQTFPAHVELIVAGDKPDFLYVLLDGFVELIAAGKEHESMIGLVEPINTLMLAAVVSDDRFLMSARTSQRSRVLMIQATAVRQAIAGDTGFSQAVVGELARAYRDVIRDYKNLRLRSAAERLANRLLILASQAKRSKEITLPYDKRTLAGLLAMTPENLSRAFATLRDYGVRVNGATVQLTNLAALRRFAKPDALIDDGAA